MFGFLKKKKKSLLTDQEQEQILAAIQSAELNTSGEIRVFVESRCAYVDAMDEMHGPMMEGVMAEDPDVAFVGGMIPHHQGAINMAKAELEHGDNQWAKDMAQMVIDAQEKEIADMVAWLEGEGAAE